MKRYKDFCNSQSNKISFGDWLFFWLKKDKRIYWPVHKNSEVTHPQRIFVGINSNAGTRPGCYIQGNGGVFIGDYVRFASNIGIISANHDLYNHSEHINNEVFIGDYCWIGQGAIVLPGVTLGPRTIVGAGAVVTKSFPEGFCVIAGNPARKIKDLDRELFVPTHYIREYYGFISKNAFIKFAQKHLKDNRYYDTIISRCESIV